MKRTKTNNFRINRYQDMLERASGNKTKMDSVIDRIKMGLASFSLGRNFNEEVDDFYDRKPELKEVRDWTRTIELDKNYNLVKY